MRILLLLAATSACTPVRKRADADLVRDISFTGNGGLLSGHNDYQLAAQLTQRESGFGLMTWPLIYTVDPVTLDRDRLIRDSYRLEVWYAHHGWFDARVQGWEVRQVRPETEDKAAVVDVRGILEPGPQSTVRSLKIEGLPPALEAIGNAALRNAPIREGDAYSLDLVEATRATLERMLHDASRPYAVVTSGATAHPEDLVVDVVLRAQPGIIGRFGDVVFDGNQKVDDLFVEEAIDVEPGQPYSVQALQDAQRRLFGLGTFAIATVEPDLSDPTRAEVPVRVDLTESRFRTFRLGVGFDYDGYVPTLRATTRLSHANLFGELVRAELGGRVGFAYDLAGTADITGRLPTFGADLELEYPRVGSPRTSIVLTGEFEQDTLVGLWAYRRPQVDLALVHALRDEANDKIQLRVGPHFENYVFIDDRGRQLTDAARGAQQLFGIEGQEFEYRLSTLDQTFTIDWRNDPIETTRGSYWSLSLREALPITDVGFGFVRGAGEARWFVPIRGQDRGTVYPFVLALRSGLTAMAPYGDTETIPLPERAFLGGSTSIRGFRPKQVGPYRTFCSYTEVPLREGFLGLGGQVGDRVTERPVVYHIPQGGSVAGELGAEVRYDWAYGIRLAGFVDGGFLTPEAGLPTAGDLRGSAGLGVRYDTAVGPIRFDISARPLFAEDRDGPTRYVGCDPPEQVPRVYDLFSIFPGLREERHPPFALVFFITIGEAF